MNFSEALDLMKQGKKVTRSSYRQKALFSTQLPEIVTIMPHWELVYPNNNTMGGTPFLASTYQAALTGADLVAEDWIEYQANSNEEEIRIEPRIETPKHIRDIYEPPIKDSQS